MYIFRFFTISEKWCTFFENWLHGHFKQEIVVFCLKFEDHKAFNKAMRIKFHFSMFSLIIVANWIQWIEKLPPSKNIFHFLCLTIPQSSFVVDKSARDAKFLTFRPRLVNITFRQNYNKLMYREGYLGENNWRPYTIIHIM